MKIKITILWIVSMITAGCSDNKKSPNLQPSGNEANIEKELKDKNEVNLISESNFFNYTLNVNDKVYFIKEINYCKKADSFSCENESLFSVYENDKLVYQDEEFEYYQFDHNNAESLKFNLDFKEIKKELKLYHFFNMYRCRNNSTFERLKSYKLGFNGDWAVQINSHTNDSYLYEKIIFFDRKTYDFKFIYNKKSYSSIPFNSESLDNTYPNLILNLSDDLNIKNLSLPSSAEFDTFNNYCDKAYDFFYNESHILDSEEKEANFIKRSYFPIYNPNLEITESFVLYHSVSEFYSESGILYNLLKKPINRPLTMQLDPLFFNKEKYPTYNLKGDELWNELYN